MNRLVIILSFMIGWMLGNAQDAILNSEECSDTSQTFSYHTSGNGNICAVIPYIFTPNRDGNIDEWCIKTTGANKIHYTITTSNDEVIKDQTWYIDENKIVCLWENGIGVPNGQSYPSGGYRYDIILTNESTGDELYLNGIVEMRY